MIVKDTYKGIPGHILSIQIIFSRKEEGKYESLKRDFFHLHTQKKIGIKGILLCALLVVPRAHNYVHSCPLLSKNQPRVERLLSW